MAITHQSISTVAAGDDVTSLAANAPSGVASGDLLVMFVGVASPIATITTPSGWMLRPSVVDEFSNTRTAIFERIADGTSTDTPTVSFGGTTDPKIFIARADGQHASPFDTSATTSQTFGSSITLPTLSTAEADELLYACHVNNAADVTSTPSGWTQIGGATATGGCIFYVWRRTAGAAGSYGGETATLAFSRSTSQAMVAYKPAAGGGGGHPAARRLLGRDFRPVEIGREGTWVI